MSGTVPAGGHSRVTIERPAAGEYNPYYDRYISLVGDGDIVETLRRQADETAALLGAVREGDAGFRYAEGKWSIRQVVGHVTDTERIMVYRAACFARGETTPLPSFDENAYVRNARFDARPLGDLVAGFRAVRGATIAFFSGLDVEEARRAGTASGHLCTVRALAFIVAGHERHHARILEERYLAELKSG